MAKIIKIFDNILNKYSCWLFILLTFVYAISRTPFYDEAYAYMVSNLSIKEIFQLIPIEGHPFLWYIFLKLFCSNLNWYPYPMLILNWLFFSVFIYLFWKKSPFSNIVKFLITFSFPFFNYYAVYARPYGLSILILGLLTYFYKDCTKKPFLYLSLILICFNTSVVAMFGAGAYFVLFIYNLLKNEVNKRKILLIIFLLLTGTILSALQFLNLESIYKVQPSTIKDYIDNFLIPSLDDNVIRIFFSIIRTILIFYIPFIFYKKSKESLFFILFTYGSLIFLFTRIYIASFWHYCFYLIYLILAIWIGYENLKQDKFLKITFICLIITFLTPNTLQISKHLFLINSNNYKKYIKKVIELNQNNNAKFYSPDWYSPVSSGIIPYLKQNDIILYDAHNIQKDTLPSMKNTYRYKFETFKGEDFIKYLEDDKNNYLLTACYFFTQGNNSNLFRFEKEGFYYKDILFFKVVYFDNKYNYIIYKIEKLKN